MKMLQSELSFRNREKVKQSEYCSCFYCLSVFKSSEVIEWVDNEDTALCPKCGIDSVIPGIIDNDILEIYNKESFG